MIAGGICKYGLTNLILPEGPENECSYAQALYYYKEDIQKYKNKGVLYFEQDGATPHTSDNNKKLIKKLFGEEPLIQNPPNSPDLAYPIENIWAYLKKQIKKEIQSHQENQKKLIKKNGIQFPKEEFLNLARIIIKDLKK